MSPGNLSIQDFTYELPDERIARYPLPERDASRLLVYRAGGLTEQPFNRLPEQLPPGTLLVFNQTKVVNARLLFRKPSGGMIEVFCLEPHRQYADITDAMATHGKVWWHCLVGGAGKWKPGMVLEHRISRPDLVLTARIVDRTATDFIIELSWNDGDLTFAEVLRAAGELPLPPYLKRAAAESDRERYQTVFARQEGSVAAPTASLHFTPELLKALGDRGIQTGMLTLHVGAGTFQPVKSETMAGHTMHEEWMEVSRDMIDTLATERSGPVVAVGTTALRTLESLYWLGVKITADPAADPKALRIGQWEPYELQAGMSCTAALRALTAWMERQGLEALTAKTQLLLAPGYSFRVVDGLVTNFHQPRSTLLLLVAALIGDDWKKVYGYALEQGFRFLSYGDSSLLWKPAGEPGH